MLSSPDHQQFELVTFRDRYFWCGLSTYGLSSTMKPVVVSVYHEAESKRQRFSKVAFIPRGCDVLKKRCLKVVFVTNTVLLRLCPTYVMGPVGISKDRSRSGTGVFVVALMVVTRDPFANADEFRTRPFARRTNSDRHSRKMRHANNPNIFQGIYGK